MRQSYIAGFDLDLKAINLLRLKKYGSEKVAEKTNKSK